MKCLKCHKENVYKANFCKYCGNKFTEEEKEIAKRKGFTGFLRMVSEWYDKTSLSVATGHPAYQIASVILVLCVGIYFIITKGTDLRLLESPNYKIQYNENNDEYYLLFSKEKENRNVSVPLELYVPNRIEKLQVIYYNDQDEILEENIYDKDATINLKPNFYVIKDLSNKEKELKVGVYFEGEETNEESK